MRASAFLLVLSMSCARASYVKDHDLAFAKDQAVPTDTCGLESTCPIGDGGGTLDVPGAALGLAALVSFTILVQWYVTR